MSVADSLDRLWVDIASPYWWVTAVLIGLLVNLASAYLKPVVDRWLTYRSGRQQEKDIAAQAEFMRQVELLASRPDLLLIECFEEQRARLRLLLYFTVSVIAVAISALMIRHLNDADFFIWTFFAFVVAFAFYVTAIVNALVSTAQRKQTLIESARKRLFDQHKA